MQSTQSSTIRSCTPIKLLWRLVVMLLQYFKSYFRKDLKPSYPILQELPNDLFWKIVHLLDSHSVMNLLRACPSLGRRVTVILGPNHEGNGKPIFFTGFPCVDLRCSSGDELPYYQGSVNLYEINTRSKHFQKFIDTEMMNLKSMSFIHFTGNVSVMGKTQIMKTLNHMQPFAPKISFQYSAPLKYPRKKRMSSVTESNNGSANSRLTFTKAPADLPSGHEYTDVSIDCWSSHTVKNISWKIIKQLEITFYKGDSTPIIQNIDLPLVQSFRIKYYEKVPLITNTKVGYASEGYNVFEMLNTCAFDVHYEAHVERESRWETYEKHMDLSFTENFDALFFVGVDCFIIFNQRCNFSRVETLFWFESAYNEIYFEGLSAENLKEIEVAIDGESFIIPHVKCFSYVTTGGLYGVPFKTTMPELEVVRIYSSDDIKEIDSVFCGVSRWRLSPDNDDEYYTNLKSVDICSDISLERVGSGDHITLGWEAMASILHSNKLKSVNISGCYIDDDNIGLFVHHRSIAKTAICPQAETPSSRSFNIELVRKIDTEIEQMDILELSLLTELATNLTSLRITQASGGEQYTPWSGLIVKVPESLLTDGLTVEIDSSFGMPQFQYREGETVYDMNSGGDITIVPPYSASTHSSRKWTANKTESIDKPWNMAAADA